MLSIVSPLLQSIAEAYAAEGATLVLTARSEDQLAEASPLETHQQSTCMRARHALLPYMLVTVSQGCCMCSWQHPQQRAVPVAACRLQRTARQRALLASKCILW